MTRFLAILLTACILFPPPTMAGKQDRQAIVLLIENGGVVEDRDAAMNTVKHLLGQLTTLKRRRATRDAQIMIVLTTMPNRVTWSGTPEQLLNQAQSVLDSIEFKSTFSDLVLAFDQIDTTLKLTMPDEYRLYWIGPAIHVPFRNGAGSELEIRVPQDVPDKIKLPDVLSRASTVKLYNIHPDQDHIYLKYFTDLGLIDAAKQGSVDFTVMDEAQTQAHLDDLL